jgi:NADH-quinone oxidoreductase subunit E
MSTNPYPETAVTQPDSFAFSPENAEAAKTVIAKYPEGRQRSAVMPLLDMAQRQEGWLSRAAMDAVAEMLGIPPIKVYEVATFYTMYNLKPVGRLHVQVCTNISCWLRGAPEIVRACRDVLGVGFGETTSDREATLAEVECLGACANAPVMQINDDLYEDLTYESAKTVLEALLKGERPAIGSQSGRRGSCPSSGPTTLKAKTPEAGKETP